MSASKVDPVDKKQDNNGIISIIFSALKKVSIHLHMFV